MPLVRPVEPTTEDERIAEEKRLEEEKKAKSGVKGKMKKITKLASAVVSTEMKKAFFLGGDLGLPPAFDR